MPLEAHSQDVLLLLARDIKIGATSASFLLILISTESSGLQRPFGVHCILPFCYIKIQYFVWDILTAFLSVFSLGLFFPLMWLSRNR